MCVRVRVVYLNLLHGRFRLRLDAVLGLAQQLLGGDLHGRGRPVLDLCAKWGGKVRAHAGTEFPSTIESQSSAGNEIAPTMLEFNWLLNMAPIDAAMPRHREEGKEKKNTNGFRAFKRGRPMRKKNTERESAHLRDARLTHKLWATSTAATATAAAAHWLAKLRVHGD